jgi:glycosyltransferase involved in cell wall biosynthesis
MAKISVFILTFNEEDNLPPLLKSLEGFTDDIVIVDSYSTDKTLEMCRAAGARVFQNKFVKHAPQCNWALETIDFRHDWVLRLDSDEMLPDKLKAELETLVATLPPDVTGIYLNRRQYFMNRWLKHGAMYPHFILRVWRKGSGVYENKTEEHFVLSHGRAVKARNDFLEDNRKNDLRFWLRKHAELADSEVVDTMGIKRDDSVELEPRLLGEKIQRTRWFKENLYLKAPLFLRALLHFLYKYIIRLGFLDGKPGFIFYVNQAFWYRFFVDSRIWEIKSRWQDIRNDYTKI